jgi:hypothetical protein
MDALRSGDFGHRHGSGRLGIPSRRWFEDLLKTDLSRGDSAIDQDLLEYLYSGAALS